MSKNGPIQNITHINWVNLASSFLEFQWSCLRELYYGIATKTFPWVNCCVFGGVLAVVVSQGWDLVAMKWFSEKYFNILWLHPALPGPLLIYKAVVLMVPFMGWVVLQALRKQRLKTQLKNIFESAGLKSLFGRTPRFSFDLPVDDQTRKLRVHRLTLTRDQFEKAKPTIESGLKVYIDEIRENRTAGTIDIIYSRHPMPSLVHLENPKDIGVDRFCVGVTRSKTVLSRFNDTPHMLVAGQTSGGKSTFLRQLITTIYLNNPHYQFTLIDLKGGLEFQLFEHLDRVEVMPSIDDAIKKLVLLFETLEERMKLIKANGAKDIQEFLKIPEEKKKYPDEVSKKMGLNRHFIFIDEAAEMFLAGHHAAAKDIQFARRVLTKIALQGRAVGVHLVIATQRPDTKALDSQIKANLTGILCFQTPNDATSISILGNGRATDLPRVAGRGIWKTGSELIEVQTPLLSPDEVNELLKPFRTVDVTSIHESKSAKKLREVKNVIVDSTASLQNESEDE